MDGDVFILLDALSPLADLPAAVRLSRRFKTHIARDFAPHPALAPAS